MVKASSRAETQAMASLAPVRRGAGRMSHALWPSAAEGAWAEPLTRGDTPSSQVVASKPHGDVK
jgi:hypothetical protein